MSKLIGSDTQRLCSGNDSVSFQAGNDIIVNNGLSYEDVKSICSDIMRKEFDIVSGEALDKIKCYLDNFIEKLLNEISSEDLYKFKEPSVQFALHNAQKIYIESEGNMTTEDLLISIIKERINNQNKENRKILLNAAIESVGSLTSSHIDYLSFIYMLRFVFNESLRSKESLRKFIIEKVLIFYSEDFLNENFYELLIYSNSLRYFEGFAYFADNEEVFRDNYQYLFSKGFIDDDLKSIFKERYELIKDLTVECLSDPTKIQFLPTSKSSISEKLKEKKLDSYINECMNLIDRTSNLDEINIFLKSIDKNFEQFLLMWKKNERFICKYLSVTQVGKILAYTNCKSKADINLDIDMVLYN